MERNWENGFCDILNIFIIRIFLSDHNVLSLNDICIRIGVQI